MKSLGNSDKILIIGGTGFLGRHLVKRCLLDTQYVTCLGLTERADRGLVLQDLEFLQADISNKEQLQSVLYGRSFDYVFNLGGYIDHRLYFRGGRTIIESHFTGLMNLIECLDIKSLKGFIQICSSDAYGSAPSPQKETMREMSISPYSFAKTAASHFMQMLFHTEGFPGVVLRLFLVYGPGQDDRRFLPQIIKACLKDEEFKTSEGKQLRDFCYVEDVVEAMVKAALSSTAKGHIINVASGIPVSIKEVIEKVIDLVGRGKPLWGTHLYRKGENMELYADISVAKSLLKWRPQTSLEDGLKKMIDYYKEQLSEKKADE